MKRSISMKTFALPLTIAAGLFIVISSADIQGLLSTGDHGRDLYAAERSLSGDLAYRDYWWVYGPLMPFYYAVFMKFSGFSIMSVLLGKAVLKFAAGLFFFLALTRITHPIAAMLGALWFYLCSQDFFFTYNHMGGTLCVTVIAAMVMSYITTLRTAYIWAAGLTSLVLCFIKPNFGLIGFIVSAAAMFIANRSLSLPSSPKRSLIYRALLIYLPILAALGYLLFLEGLPLYQIRQCMPYADVDQTYHTSAWTALSMLWSAFIRKFFTSIPDFLFGWTVIICFVRTAYLAVNRRLSFAEDRRHLIAILILGIYMTFNFHEYLKSGVWYRYLWAQPLELLLFFTIIALALRQVHRYIRTAVWIAIAAIMLLSWHDRSLAFARIRQPQQYLSHPKAKVFVTNDPSWIRTLNETTDFLEKNLRTDELFFALPYDPIYYFMTGRKSPTQLLLFCDQQHIPREQEERVIADLEKAKINWIVVSSRMRSQEPGLGTLGVTYGRLIGSYLNKNFEHAARFGDWQNEPGWAWNHGTLILKRKHPAP